MNFVLGGYFLVEARQRQEWMNGDAFPAWLWSVSPCICAIYPDAWAWAADNTEAEAYFRGVLRLDDGRSAAVRADVKTMAQNREFEYPNVFFSADAARQFHERYLSNL